MNRSRHRASPWLLAAFALALARPGGSAIVAAASAGDRLSFERDGHASFPFESRGQHIWVRGRVNGADSVWIVIDTGASGSVLDSTAAQALQLPETGQHEVKGAGGVQTSGTVRGGTREVTATLRRLL